jgi:hypothetical protein
MRRCWNPKRKTKNVKDEKEQKIQKSLSPSLRAERSNPKKTSTLNHIYN